MGDGVGRWALELVQADTCRSLTWDFLVVMVAGVGGGLACSYPGVCYFLKGKLLIPDRAAT